MSNSRPDRNKQKVHVDHNLPHANEIIACFIYLNKIKMLTKDNYIAIAGNPETASKVDEGLQHLKSKDLITLENVTAIAHAGKYAKDLAQAYSTLNTLGIELTKDVRDALDGAEEEIALVAGSILTNYADSQSKATKKGIGKLADEITHGVQQLEEAGQLSVNTLAALIEKEKTGNDSSSKKLEVDRPLSFFSSTSKKPSNDASIAPQAGVGKPVKPAR